MENEDFERTLPPAFDYRDSFQWWEKKRWIFNLAVGLSGFTTLVIIRNVDLPDIIGAIFYGLLANLFYSLGSWLEMADAHYLRGALGLYRARIMIFLIGTIGSMLLTTMGAYLYGSHGIMNID